MANNQQNQGKQTAGQKSSGNPNQSRDQSGQFVSEEDQNRSRQQQGNRKQKSSDEEE